jgi:hypothetical protein
LSLAGITLLATALAFGGVALTRGSSHVDQRAALQAYLDALHPIAVDAGRVVELSIKPGVTELESRTPKPDLAGRAAGWQRQLAGVDDRLAALDPPIELVDATDRMRAAVAGYKGIAAAVEDAAGLAATQRREAGAEARRQGETSDDIWDEGALLIQQRAAALSLPAVSWLPDGKPLNDATS